MPLATTDVIVLHNTAIEELGGLPRMHSYGLLESAVAYPSIASARIRYQAQQARDRFDTQEKQL